MSAPAVATRRRRVLCTCAYASCGRRFIAFVAPSHKASRRLQFCSQACREAKERERWKSRSAVARGLAGPGWRKPYKQRAGNGARQLLRCLQDLTVPPLVGVITCGALVWSGSEREHLEDEHRLMFGGDAVTRLFVPVDLDDRGT